MYRLLRESDRRLTSRATRCRLRSAPPNFQVFKRRCFRSEFPYDWPWRDLTVVVVVWVRANSGFRLVDCLVLLKLGAQFGTLVSCGLGDFWGFLLAPPVSAYD